MVTFEHTWGAGGSTVAAVAAASGARTLAMGGEFGSALVGWVGEARMHTVLLSLLGLVQGLAMKGEFGSALVRSSHTFGGRGSGVGGTVAAPVLRLAHGLAMCEYWDSCCCNTCLFCCCCCLLLPHAGVPSRNRQHTAQGLYRQHWLCLSHIRMHFGCAGRADPRACPVS